MEIYQINRPKKTLFSKEEQSLLQEEAVKKIKKTLMPLKGIDKILLVGSSVKGTFGMYDPPGYKGKIYSDFDFIIFVDDDYKIPKGLLPELNSKPFADQKLNLTYRIDQFLRNIYDAKLLFIRESSANDDKVQEFGESMGIPFSDISKNSFLQIYPKPDEDYEEL